MLSADTRRCMQSGDLWVICNKPHWLILAVRLGGKLLIIVVKMRYMDIVHNKEYCLDLCKNSVEISGEQNPV